jgi:hypothetical protein
LDTWLGTIGQDRGTGLEPRVKHLADGSWLHYNKEVPRGGIHEFRTYPDSTLSFEAVLGDGAWSSITWTVEIRYVQVQRKHDVAARTTCVGKLDVLEARPQSDMPEQRYEHFLANIEVFPAVFERGEYLVPGEEDTQEPWARNPSEAIKLVLLHELGHLEAYASANAKMMTYHVTEDSEQTANDFASSVVRCQE